MKNLKLQNELNALNEKRAQVKKENTVVDDFPVLKRTYTYRKSIVIKANDLNL